MSNFDPGAASAALDHPPVAEKPDVDWSRYAACYDLLLQHNPAYQDLLTRFSGFLSSLPGTHGIRRVLDAGGGTGNFTAVLMNRMPKANVTLLEPDAGMRARAAQKLAGASSRVQTVSMPLEAFGSAGAFDLIVCTHALYAMPDPQARLRQLFDLTRPGGWMFIIDVGRAVSVLDWKIYLAWSLVRRLGLFGAVRVLREGRVMAEQNRLIAERQRQGFYWEHTPQTFDAALKAAGWQVEQSETVYRGYSDLAICRRAAL